MAEYNELLTTQIGLVSSLARALEIIHKSGRYGVLPTAEWVSEMVKSGRYGTPPTSTWITDITKSGRYGGKA